MLNISMTTPAISVSGVSDASMTQSFFNQNCDGSTSSGVIGTVTHAKRRTEVRPASVNHPRNRAGWRVPGAWNHSKLVDNPRVAGIIRSWVNLPGTGGCAKGKYSDEINSNQWGLDGASLPAMPSYLEGRAVSRALLKLKHQQVNLAVAFAERKQTIDMFKHNARKIAKQVNIYKGKYPRNWAQVLKGNGKNSPNSWLELQYGWKPLISDLTGACMALSEAYSGGFNPYLAKVSGVAGQNFTNGPYRKVCSSPTKGFDVTDKGNHICRVVLYYKLRNPTLAAFSSLGLTNPFELAWEKMKYSFVVDWFLPVGNWLSTLDADFGWDFHSGTVSKMSSLETHSKWRSIGLPPGVIRLDYSGSTYSAAGFNMTRGVYATAPWGGIPRFKNPLSGLHVANAVALLAQSFRKFKGIDRSKYTD